eukprot:sb/3461377/
MILPDPDKDGNIFFEHRSLTAAKSYGISTKVGYQFSRAANNNRFIDAVVRFVNHYSGGGTQRKLALSPNYYKIIWSNIAETIARGNPDLYPGQYDESVWKNSWAELRSTGSCFIPFFDRFIKLAAAHCLGRPVVVFGPTESHTNGVSVFLATGLSGGEEPREVPICLGFDGATYHPLLPKSSTDLEKVGEIVTMWSLGVTDVELVRESIKELHGDEEVVLPSENRKPLGEMVAKRRILGARPCLKRRQSDMNTVPESDGITGERTFTTVKRFRIVEENIGSGSSSSFLSPKSAVIVTHPLMKQGIELARKYFINLAPGRPNNGNGNCSIESVIDQINNRTCFQETFPRSVQFYRDIWMSETERQARNSAFFLDLYTEEEWREAWTRLRGDGQYEVDYFGDLMILGIMHCVGKNALVFNVSEYRSHGPITVVRGDYFGGSLSDDQPPLVLAYDGAHYESLMPVGEGDVRKTRYIVEQWSRFDGADMWSHLNGLHWFTEGVQERTEEGTEGVEEGVKSENGKEGTEKLDGENEKAGEGIEGDIGKVEEGIIEDDNGKAGDGLLVKEVKTEKMSDIDRSSQDDTCQLSEIFSWLDYSSLVRYVMHAMNATQQATVHNFGGRILLNLLTNNPDKSSPTLHEAILAEGGRQTMRKLVRTHREDKHIQHTVSLILDLLLEQQCRMVIEAGGDVIEVSVVPCGLAEDVRGFSLTHGILVITTLTSSVHSQYLASYMTSKLPPTLSDSDDRAQLVAQLERATELLSAAEQGLNGMEQPPLSPGCQSTGSRTPNRTQLEVQLEARVEEQCNELKVQNCLLESKNTTIEQLHRQLEHTLSNNSDTGLEQENKSLREKLAKERERWAHTQQQLEGNMEGCYDLVKEMAAALRVMKAELGEGSCVAAVKQDYSTWNAVKDELIKMSRGLSVLGNSAEEELTYHYDMVDVGRNEAVQLQNTMDIASSNVGADIMLSFFVCCPAPQPHLHMSTLQCTVHCTVVENQMGYGAATQFHEKDEALRRYERTHSQSSLDLSVVSEEKATKTLDKLQMVRKAIHELEQSLEVEEERLEKLRQKRFIRPLQNISESDPDLVTSLGEDYPVTKSGVTKSGSDFT